MYSIRGIHKDEFKKIYFSPLFTLYVFTTHVNINIIIVELPYQEITMSCFFYVLQHNDMLTHITFW